MKCVSCGWEYPYDIEFHNGHCVACDDVIKPTPEEYLEHSELGIATEVRDDQVKLTALIRSVIANREKAIIEAGTGIGKSFAYLLPILLNNKYQAVISTAKKSLQTQLYEKDIPYLSKKLQAPIRSALLFGKNNYICKYNVVSEQNPYFMPSDADYFFKHARFGTWDEVPQVFKNSKSKLKVLKQPIAALSVDKCTGPMCRYYKDCKYTTARNQVAAADVIVTNHWMVGYELRISGEDRHVSLLGKTNKILIVDEAHKFEEAVRQAHTDEIKEAELFRHYNTLARVTGEHVDNIYSGFPALTFAWKDFFARARQTAGTQRLKDAQLAKPLIAELNNTIVALHADNIIGRYVHYCVSNGEATGTQFAFQLKKAVVNYTTGLVEHAGFDSALAQTVPHRAYYEFYQFLYDTLAMLCDYETPKDNVVHYLESQGGSSVLKSAPLNVAPLLRKYYDCTHENAKFSSITYLSATLAVNKNFGDFASRIGLALNDPQVKQANYPTAFDYDKQARFYVAAHIPEPEQSQLVAYREAAAAEIRTLITASKGNAFVLFTSKDDLDYMTPRIAEGLDENITLISQRDYTAPNALQRYKTTNNSVLLGLKSFWEGIDIQGDKLQLVIITKLPFPNSRDPIVSARSELAGDTAFIDVIIPDMISDLRQGTGRLLRTKTDQGVVAILDSRVVKKSYKNVILNSLGVSSVVTNQERIVRGLEYLASQRGVTST